MDCELKSVAVPEARFLAPRSDPFVEKTLKQIERWHAVYQNLVVRIDATPPTTASKVSLGLVYHPNIPLQHGYRPRDMFYQHWAPPKHLPNPLCNHPTKRWRIRVQTLQSAGAIPTLLPDKRFAEHTVSVWFSLSWFHQGLVLVGIESEN